MDGRMDGWMDEVLAGSKGKAFHTKTSNAKV